MLQCGAKMQFIVAIGIMVASRLMPLIWVIGKKIEVMAESRIESRVSFIIVSSCRQIFSGIHPTNFFVPPQKEIVVELRAKL